MDPQSIAAEKRAETAVSKLVFDGYWAFPFGGKMKTKRIIKWICGIAAMILAALLLLIGSFVYATRYRTSDVDAATSPDGKHEIVFQAVREPDWPFGYSHARIVLKRNGETVAKRKIEICFVPLTARSIVFLEENGIPLLNWRDSD